eukprot:EG_transcript_35940
MATSLWGRTATAVCCRSLQAAPLWPAVRSVGVGRRAYAGRHPSPRPAGPGPAPAELPKGGFVDRFGTLGKRLMLFWATCWCLNLALLYVLLKLGILPGREGRDLLESLGADRFVDYEDVDFEKDQWHAALAVNKGLELLRGPLVVVAFPAAYWVARRAPK